MGTVPRSPSEPTFHSIGGWSSRSLAWERYAPQWIKANSARALVSALGAVLLLSGA
ncbi:hypothetical protein ATK23_1161 [Glutamicibacter mysorens]|uniref:Uncharacterized protein n=1 Tax=Glutamicibacter mysorens TaxID=257984 RepID=A0ABX4MXJ7_9MICC|nr:hypothetical protein ATK23_1161 [Glutamicibacter mysorens]